MLLHDLIYEATKNHGSRIALYRGNESVDFATLAEMVNETSAAFNAMGIRAGERLAVYSNKRIEAIVAFFAASRAGAVMVPINPLLKPTQVRHILDDCGATGLITSGGQTASLSGELLNCRSLKYLISIASDNNSPQSIGTIEIVQWAELARLSCSTGTLPRRIDNDMAAILYTSGSTGLPKGVVLSHRNLINGAISVAGYIENVPEDVILSVLPLSFDAGFSQLTTAFSTGASIVLVDYLLPRDVLKVASRFCATGLTGVPPLWNQLVKADWPQEVKTTMRYIANTGGAMPTATLKRLRQTLPKTKVFLMYGLTEAFRSTYLPPDQVDKRPTSIGKAIPDAEVLVVREDGSACSPGEPGELVHRGALVAMGYWNDPQRSATRFRPAPNQPTELPFPELAVWSGDTVVADDDGYLYFVGRRDDMIKSSGYRISPTEVEEVVYSTGLVFECAAVGVPHPELGHVLIIAAHGPNPTSEAATDIINACKHSLANYMVPARVLWQDGLPRNPNGKIDRREIAANLEEYFSDDD